MSLETSTPFDESTEQSGGSYSPEHSTPEKQTEKRLSAKFNGLDDIISILTKKKGTPTSSTAASTSNDFDADSVDSVEPVDEQEMVMNAEKMFHCPMKSCDSKMPEEQIQYHLSSSHPDVYTLYRRTLMDKYDLSIKYCEKCGFHFSSTDAFDNHLLELKGKVNCDQNRNRMLPVHMEIYLKSQCREKLVQVVEIEEDDIKKEFDDDTKSEPRSDFSKGTSNGKVHTEPFMCPIKDCGESQATIGLILTHMEAEHEAENYFFRTRFNCLQLQTRCVSCQFSFPSESYLQNHNCRQFQDIAERNSMRVSDTAIDNIISDSLLADGVEMASTDKNPDDYVRESTDELGLTKLRGFKCPIIKCSMKTERLAGILRHLFTRHGYEGLLFRLSTDVWGMNERCSDCGFNFDHTSNSLYKHKYDKACEKNVIRRKELEAEYEKMDPQPSVEDLKETIDFDAFKDRVHVDDNRHCITQPPPSQTSSDFAFSATNEALSKYSLAAITNDWKSSPKQKPFMPSYQPGIQGNELIYRCPIVGCGKAFSKLGGIFKHLVPAHGYQGVLFRMEFDVPGLMMICETCKWNYADKNAIYKHRHLNTCVSNIRITKEQEEKYQGDPNRRTIEDLRTEIDFNILKNLHKPDLGYPSMPFNNSNSINTNFSADNSKGANSTLNGSDTLNSTGVSIKITNNDDTGSKPDGGEDDTIDGVINTDCDLSASLTNAGLENLTPQQAAELLKIIQGQVQGTKTGMTARETEAQMNGEDFNKCPAWGCKRKFTAFTHGGKSNISSLWIHMQNAHRNAFVVFRRLKRPGFDKYCEKCHFWLKGAEWYNHRNLRRYQSEGNRPEGTYCDVYQRLAEGLQDDTNHLSLLNVRMCVERYECQIADADHLMAEQAMQDDNLSEGLGGSSFMDTLPSMLNFNGTDSPTFTFNRPGFNDDEMLGDVAKSICAPPMSSTPKSDSRVESPLPTQLVCPVKSCQKLLLKSESSAASAWKNLFTHMKAHHRNAYVIFRRLQRESTKKQCPECLFWFNNYRDFGAHNQHTGNKREQSYKGTYCGQYQEMALNNCKVTNIHELPTEEAMDFNVLETIYKCRIPFELDDFEDASHDELKIEEIEDEKPTPSMFDLPSPALSFTSPTDEGFSDTAVALTEKVTIHPSHKPEEGSYVCPVRGCSQVIKTMKGVLGHMRIKHKREYVMFRRTKMATAHRKCDECHFWFQSAKTYHQHRSQLPNQLPGENKGSECDAYVRIATQFTVIELNDLSTFVKPLLKFYTESTYQDKPANRKKPTFLSELGQALSTSNGTSNFDSSSFGLSGMSLLNPDTLNLLQQPVTATPIEIPREPDFTPVPIPEDQNSLIECPVIDCQMHIKFSSLNIHFSRKHPAAFYHFKKSDFDIFTIRCSVCGFGYYNHLHFQHSHRDCSLQVESRVREKVSDEEFELARTCFSLKLALICKVKPVTNGNSSSPESKASSMSPSFLKAKNELSNFQQKMEDLDKYDSISEVKCRCPEKNCIYVAPLRTLTTHLAEKHPKINVEFRTRPSEYFDQKCDSCQFYFYSRSSLYNHRSTKKCEVYAQERMKYQLWIEEKGKDMQESIMACIRPNIKYDRENKRKSLAEALISDPKKPRTSEELYRGIEAESREKMNSSLEEERSTNPKSALALPARDCPYCKAQMNTSLFSALNSHVRSMHPDRYLEFRTTKWSETTVICERCKFGSELPINGWQQSHTIKKCNENIACYKKYESKNISFEEPVRGDEVECPQCSQKNNGAKGLVTHFRIAHLNEYLPWRTKIGPVLTVQCQACKFCYSCQSELDTHSKKEGGCKKNMEMQKNGLEPINNATYLTQKESQKEMDETDFIKCQNAQARLCEFSCDYCQNGVSFPTFGLLCVHMKQEHRAEYIQFRIKKTAQIPFRCQMCQFCFPDQKTYDRHNAKKQCQKFKRQYDDYIESLEDDDADSDSDGDGMDITNGELNGSGDLESGSSQPSGERYVASDGVAMCSWILCPIKTCSDSIQLIELESHFNMKHSNFRQELLGQTLSTLPSLTWKCTKCKYVTFNSGTSVSPTDYDHTCSTEDSTVKNTDLLDDTLHQVVARCPRIDCGAEFNYSSTVWSEIDHHLSLNHEIHWLYFKKQYLKSATTSRLIQCDEGQLTTFNTIKNGGQLSIAPNVEQCQRCLLYLLPEETQLHHKKCHALKCTIREFTTSKCNILNTQIKNTFTFHTKKLYL